MSQLCRIHVVNISPLPIGKVLSPFHSMSTKEKNATREGQLLEPFVSSCFFFVFFVLIFREGLINWFNVETLKQNEQN